MSLDKSLKSHGALSRHRNVLSRAERVERLTDEEKREAADTVFGLPKVAHRKVTARKPKAAPKPEGELVAEGAEAASPAEGEAAAAQPADAKESKEKA